MLTLILPALLRPPVDELPELDTPVLNTILRFAQVQHEDIPLSRLYAEHLHISFSLPDNTVYASPVWQQIGMHSMSLLDAASVGITADEAQSLCCGLNEFYRNHAHFSVIRPDLWQVTLPSMPKWVAPPVFEILGHIDGSVRAEGEQQQQWLQMQTEIQMWLHDHPMNRHRREQQKPPINGIWLWNPPDDVLPVEEPAKLLGTDSVWATKSLLPVTAAPYDLLTWQKICQDKYIDIQNTTLLLEDLLLPLYTNDLWAYRDTLHQWEHRFFAPLWDAVANRRLDNARIITNGIGGGMVMVNPPPFWSWFKGKRIFDGRTL